MWLLRINRLLPEEWVRIMLEELRTRVSSIGAAYAQELKGAAALLHKMEGVLVEKEVFDEEQ
jgi:hypothetical protein